MGSEVQVPRRETQILNFPPGAKSLVIPKEIKDEMIRDITAFFIEGYFAEGKKLSVLENKYGKQFVELEKEAKSLTYMKGNTEEAKESKAALDKRMGEIQEKNKALITEFYAELERDFPFLAYKNINFNVDKIAKTEKDGKYRILDREKSGASVEKLVKTAISDILSYGGKVSAAAKKTEENFKNRITNVIYAGMGGGPVTIGVGGSSENAVNFNAVLSDKLVDSLSEPLEKAGVKIRLEGFKQESVFISSFSPPTEFQTENEG